MPNVALESLEGLPPFLNKNLKQLPVSTFGVFKGFLHPCDVGFQHLDALGVRCSGQERSPSYAGSHAFLS